MPKKLRDRFEDCYTAVPVPAGNARGFKMKYIYYAPWHVWDLPEKQLRRLKWALLLCSAAGLCASLSAMVQRSPLNRTPAVFALCALALCCHIMELLGLVQFVGARYRTTKMTYEEVGGLLSVMPTARAALSGVLTVVCAIHAVLGGGAVSLGMALGFALSAAAALWVRHQYSRIPVKTEENDSLKQYDKGVGENFSIERETWKH